MIELQAVARAAGCTLACDPWALNATEKKRLLGRSQIKEGGTEFSSLSPALFCLANRTFVLDKPKRIVYNSQ